MGEPLPQKYARDERIKREMDCGAKRILSSQTSRHKGKNLSPALF